MESTISVSKGVFLFKNGAKKTKTSKKTRDHSLFEKWFRQEPWYKAYRANWEQIQNKIKDLDNKTYSLLLNDIVNYVKSFYTDEETAVFEGIVPSATLLTGVNQPDHVSQFAALISKIREEITPHIAMVHSQDAPSLKHLMENVVWQLVKSNEDMDLMDTDELDNSMEQAKKLRKNQCTVSTLKKWYRAKYDQVNNSSPSKRKKHASRKKSLVVIIPDFESFNCSVLQDFVMIMSSCVPRLPLVLVFGVATSVSALHAALPHAASCKLLVKVFHSHSSPVYMNQVLEDIFLTPTSPFHLSGKAFELLTDVFLFYDFSVTGLIQSIKYCMMDHYYGDNTKSLCCSRDELEQRIIDLTSEDLESIRQLPSFRPFLESKDCRTKISLFEDDAYFRESLFEEINRLHDYLYSFYACLRLLSVFLKDLPKNIMGKTVREMYTQCATQCITQTPAFKECMTLLSFQSQIKIVESLKSALKIINSTLNVVSPIKPLKSTPTKNNRIKENRFELKEELGESFLKTVKVHLLTFLRHIQIANTEATFVVATADLDDSRNDAENTPGNRYKLKQQLLKATQVDKVQSEFDMVRGRLLHYLEDMFSLALQPPHSRPFNEMFFFSDAGGVRRQLVGSPRGAVHTALSNPQHYLQCLCCALPAPGCVLGSLPAVSVAYKLHRECGRLVNLYDWLQACAAVLQPAEGGEGGEEGQEGEEERRRLDPRTQRRFSRAVAELQLLGFIKPSKRKTDHVMRLTW